jgi:hypothetical protein
LSFGLRARGTWKVVGRGYERLRHLMWAYFHQDWPLESADWQGVVRHYRGDVSPDEAAATAEAIVRLLGEGQPESQLADRLLREFGCYYDPRPDLGGPALRDWLLQVAAALR